MINLNLLKLPISCSLLVPLVHRSLGGIICVASISFFFKGTYQNNFNTLIRMFNSIRIRIFYFRKPKKVSSDYRQDTESVKLEDTVSYTVQFDYYAYSLLKTIFFSIKFEWLQRSGD